MLDRRGSRSLENMDGAERAYIDATIFLDWREMDRRLSRVESELVIALRVLQENSGIMRRRVGILQI